MIIIEDVGFKIINDLMHNGVIIGQGISEGQDVAVNCTALSP